MRPLPFCREFNDVPLPPAPALPLFATGLGALGSARLAQEAERTTYAMVCA